MVAHTEKGVGVRRQIHTDYFRFFIYYVINKSGVLMAEAVVVLSPYMGGKQII
jgi:hypothetical protein